MTIGAWLSTTCVVFDIEAALLPLTIARSKQKRVEAFDATVKFSSRAWLEAHHGPLRKAPASSAWTRATAGMADASAALQS